MEKRARVSPGLIMELGASEVFFRFQYGKRGQLKSARYLGPAVSIVAGISGIFVLLFWEGGTRWFYFYQEGYKLFFHT